MTTDPGDSLPTNAEWRLCELVDALAAELDCVADTLSLKSHARGSALSVQKLGLDLRVDVRVDERGVPVFRTVEPGRETCATLLKLDLGLVFKSQLEEVRKPLDEESDGRPVSVLPEIGAAEVEALGRLGIFTVDDLVRYLGSSSRIAEVARRTGISEARLRGWVGLPFLTTLEPLAASPGGRASLRGGNLGAVRPESGRVIAAGREAEVISWSDRNIEFRLPEADGDGEIWVDFGAHRTNRVDWRPEPLDPAGLLTLSAAANPPRQTTGEDVRCIFTLRGGRSGLARTPFVVRFDPERLALRAVEPAPDETAAGLLSWSDLGALPAGGSRGVGATFSCLPIKSARRTRQTARVEGALDEQGHRVGPVESALEVLLIPSLRDLAPVGVVERLLRLGITTVPALAAASVEKLLEGKFTLDEAEHWIREAGIALGDEAGNL